MRGARCRTNVHTRSAQCVMVGVCLVLFAWLQPAFAAEKPLPRATPESLGLNAADFAKIDDAVRVALERHAAPGVVVVIVHKGIVVFRKAYGYRSLEPEKLLMLPEIVFDLASLTKPIATATAAMLLIEEGKLKVTDPISKYLPAMRRQETDKLTVENLLLHTSGFIPDNPISDYQDGPAKAWDRLCALNPLREPGKKFSYSDVNYILLGKIVENVSGQPLDVFTAQRIYRPLGLDATGYKPGAKLRAQAAPTEKRHGAWIIGTVHDPRSFALGGVAGHAGLFSTADDLAVFAQMLLNGGEYAGTRILKAETVKYMTDPRPVALSGGRKGLRTYGWDMQTPYAGNRGDVFPADASYGHSGFTGTSIWIDPTSQTTVIVLTNSVHPNGKGNVLSLRHRVATLAALAVGVFKK